MAAKQKNDFSIRFKSAALLWLPGYVGALCISLLWTAWLRRFIVVGFVAGVLVGANEVKQILVEVLVA